MNNLAPRYITFDELRDSLPPEPLVVGFDVDDTVLFSSPGFFFGMHNTDAPGAKNRYGDNPAKNPQFWRDLNQFHDRYSMKKLSGEKLLRMHAERGDSIVFITKRWGFDDDAEVLKKRLDAMCSVHSISLFFTNQKCKTPRMRESGIDMYYGDSDSDIEAAMAVTTKNVRPVRVQRSTTSIEKQEYNPGFLGEEVLVDSAD